MRFQVRWLDEASWTVREEVFESATEQGAIGRLPGGAVRLLSATRVGTGLLGPRPRALRVDVPWWCRELRVLLAAGMTVVEAVATMGSQARDPGRLALHESLATALQSGKSLSAAMNETQAFPAVFIAGVVASERTGALIEALDDYLRYHDMVEQLRRKLVSAALYPVLVLSVGLLVVMFLLWFVVPRFSAAYADLRGAVGGATQGLLLASALLRAHSIGLGAVVVGVLLAVAWAWRRGVILVAAMSLADKVPLLRSTLDDFRRAKLFHALALMFRGGYTLPEALDRCLEIGLGERWVRSIRRAGGALMAGTSAAQALADAGLADPVGEKLMAVGERTGNFAHVLQTIADRHSGQFSTTVERMTRLAEPLLLLVVASVIGGVVVLMYLPIFDLASSLR